MLPRRSGMTASPEHKRGFGLELVCMVGFGGKKKNCRGGKYNRSHSHHSGLQVLPTAANSVQTLTFPSFAIFQSRLGRSLLVKIPWDSKGVTRLAWGQTGK